MSGIFNLFGGTGNAAKQQSSLGPTDISKKFAMSSTTFGGGGMAAKNVGLSRTKPKGLSIRSGNDLNISSLSIKSSKSPTKTGPIKGLVKPDSGLFDGNCRPVSPRNKAKAHKMQVLKSKQLKALSSKTRSPESDLACGRKQVQQTIFKKPLTPGVPARKTKVYPERETLAHYYDYEKEMDDFYLDYEFVKLTKETKKPVKPYEDEGFVSDPEIVQAPSPPRDRIFDDSFDEDLVETKPTDLPSLSDDEDFWAAM